MPLVRACFRLCRTGQVSALACWSADDRLVLAELDFGMRSGPASPARRRRPGRSVGSAVVTGDRDPIAPCFAGARPCWPGSFSATCRYREMRQRGGRLSPPGSRRQDAVRLPSGIRMNRGLGLISPHGRIDGARVCDQARLTRTARLRAGCRCPERDCGGRRPFKAVSAGPLPGRPGRCPLCRTTRFQVPCVPLPCRCSAHARRQGGSGYRPQPGTP